MNERTMILFAVGAVIGSLLVKLYFAILDHKQAKRDANYEAIKAGFWAAAFANQIKEEPEPTTEDADFELVEQKRIENGQK